MWRSLFLALFLSACSGSVFWSGDAGQEVVGTDAGGPPPGVDEGTPPPLDLGVDASIAPDDLGMADMADMAASDGGPPDGGPPDMGPLDMGPPVVGLDARPSNTTCFAPDPPVAGGPIRLELEEAFTALPTLDLPLFLTQAPGLADRFYVVEKRGRVYTFTGDGSNNAIFINIETRVDSVPGEGGLLGMAFHPDFATNGYVYLSYTATVAGDFESRVSRFTSPDNGLTLDPTTETRIITVDQPGTNHNGGWVGFGPDGYLYFALGDGGGPGDVSQDTFDLLGSILRLDVDGTAPYAIPATNPFADGIDGEPEIYAYGLRNPWRVSFDTLTGDFWAGDVGASREEEVDIITLGGNYGWDIVEGNLCHRPRVGCSRTGLIDPVHSYGRTDGVSVTGGYVYRGTELGSDMFGVYLFSDNLTGTLWGLFDDGMGGYTRRTLMPWGAPIASFGQDHDGELYAINLFDADQVFQVVRSTAPPTGGPANLLSQTGCMDAMDPSLPGPALIPYAPTATLWSDDATKERWMALPDGEEITFDADGDFVFPNGTVLIKQFRFNGRLVETRFYVRFDDGEWGGWTYRWNDAQTDAVLLEEAGSVEVGGDTWTIPSRNQCSQCHTEVAGRSLGLEIAQLNADFLYPTGRTANQLHTLEQIGVTEALPAPFPMLDSFPAYDDATATVEDRARAYMHSNCSNCHRPSGPGRGDLDLRADTALVDTGACDEVPQNGDLGIVNARILAPSAPDRSLLLQRPLRLDEDRMPPLATSVVDTTGTGLIEDWIDGIAACP